MVRKENNEIKKKNKIEAQKIEERTNFDNENIYEKSDKCKEDSTKYGEFVSSYFSWISQEQQKKIVDKLENITKKEEKNKNN